MSELGAPALTLPLDVVRLIVRAALWEAEFEDDPDCTGGPLRDLASAVSLVCRQLRDEGQRVLWRELELGGQGRSPLSTRVVAVLNSPRLAGFVRTICWEGKDDGDGELDKEGTALDELAADQAVYPSLLEACRCLRSLELSGMSSSTIVWALGTAGSAHAARSLRHLRISSSDEPSPSTAADLAASLLSFPGLTGLDVVAVGTGPGEGQLVDQVGTGTLPVAELTLQYRPYHPQPSTAFSLYLPFLRHLDPSSLDYLYVDFPRTAEPVLEWLSRHTFPNLSSLHLTDCGVPSSTLPRLTPLLRHLPSLTHLFLRSHNYEPVPTCSSPDDLLALTRFLTSLPPSLTELSLNYRLDSSSINVDSLPHDYLSHSHLTVFTIDLLEPPDSWVIFQRELANEAWVVERGSV